MDAVDVSKDTIKPRSQDRATIHLVDQPVFNTTYDLEALYPGISKDLKNGDIIEFLQDSGYRSQGIKMVLIGNEDLVTYLVDQDIDCDDYGSPSANFTILKDFPPRYWNLPLRVNDKYAPGQKTKFYWHSEKLPLTLNESVIVNEVLAGRKYKFKQPTNFQILYVIVEYEGEKYGVILDDQTIVDIESGKNCNLPEGYSTTMPDDSVPTENWIALYGTFD